MTGIKERRAESLRKAIERAKDPDFKMLWSLKLKELYKDTPKVSFNPSSWLREVN
jgi:hypothetical protein|tara:strand:- start:105 stop:269 length:165 start_codon:yes stop_codon:yes gene_type:complete